MRRVEIALAGGLLIGVAAVAVTLSGAPATVAAVNTRKQQIVGATDKNVRICQSNETLPRDITAIRLRLFTQVGPRITLEILAHGHVIVHGQRRSGWIGGAVTVPLKPLSTPRSGVTLCFNMYPGGDETVQVLGERATLTFPGIAGERQPRVGVEYLRAGRSSWWSLGLSVARRMGLGHAASGTWCVPLVIALMATVVLLCSRQILRELDEAL